MSEPDEEPTTFQKFKDIICCTGKAKYPTPYEFQVDAKQLPLKNKLQFESNFVRTSKYSLLSFLPKALFLQFMRLANVYFLVIAILLSITVISPLNPLTAWAPLVIVIAISMIRQGFQDFARYKSDQILNHKQTTMIFRSGKWDLKMKWGNVLVGDICKVENQQQFPADLVLLSSNFPNGSAFIETASLDGQKNYKPRSAFKQTMGLGQGDISSIKGSFKGDKPNPDLHHFNGTMAINNSQVVIRGDKQLLYRGTKLMATDYIYGLVVYTGKNTKIMKNSQAKTPEKMSQVENKVNHVLGIVLCIQVVFCVVIAIFYGVFRNQSKDDYYYIDWTEYSTPVDSIIIFFTYFVLINTMIPISLIVSMEMVKLFQKYFINKDKFMYSEWRMKWAEVKVASLNEELGQIEYVFTDKTGTLTKNLMEFKIATIAQQMFGDVALIAPKGSSEKPSTEPGFKDEHLKDLLRSGAGNQQLKQPIIIKNKQGQQKITLKTLKDVANQYFTALSLAHEVVIQKKDGKQKFQGPSPDEVSLVQAAKEMNYEFFQATQNTTSVKILGKQEKYEVLALFPFTSDRKRMSIIVKQGSLIKMYIKGADSIIKERLSKDNKLDLDDELNRFSVIGLRTLLIAMRVISDKQFADYKKAMLEVKEGNREEEIKKLESDLQSELYIIGATAVLDRLQDDVPETIRDMLRANIKVWMLTGDKMETAENIAKSCNLIQPRFHILKYKPPTTGSASKKKKPPQSQEAILNQKNEQDLQTAEYIYEVETSLEGYIASLIKEAETLSKSGIPKALMIEGSDLKTVIYQGKDTTLQTQSDGLQKQLAILGSYCQAVVCCRLLPKQKQDLVGMVRKHLNKITLAIGDGANDVAMIKQAHIGVGLHGQEGMGAVQAADYTLPQFRMLWRLLFVHGRWNYMRISEMILYFFYKNMLFTIPQFLNGFFCGYSGQTIYDDVYVTLYNLIFTALPLIVRAVLQQDVNYIFQDKPTYDEFPAVSGKSMISQVKKLPEKYHINKYFYRLFPKIYFIGQQNCIFNYRNYFAWLVEGMLEATIITVVLYFILSQTAVNGKGYSSSYWLVGLTIYSAVILVVTFKLSSHTRFWSLILFVTIIFFSLGFYVAYMWLSNYALSDHVQGTAYIAWTSIQTYFVVLFCVCMVLFVDGLVVFLDFRRGSYASKMREIVHKEQINNRAYYDEVSVTLTSGLTASEQANQ